MVSNTTKTKGRKALGKLSTYAKVKKVIGNKLPEAIEDKIGKYAGLKNMRDPTRKQYTPKYQAKVKTLRKQKEFKPNPKSIHRQWSIQGAALGKGHTLRKVVKPRALD